MFHIINTPKMGQHELSSYSKPKPVNDGHGY